ncbi:hypothetical protein ABPG75_013745 [Micractinium tetrahymenae]
MSAAPIQEEDGQQQWEQAATAEHSPDVAAFSDAAQLFAYAAELLPLDASGRPALRHTAEAHRRLLLATLLAVQAGQRCPQPLGTDSDTARHIGAYLKLCWPCLCCCSSIEMIGTPTSSPSSPSSSSSFFGCSSPRCSSEGSPSGGCSPVSESCGCCASLAELSDVLLLFSQAAGFQRQAQPLDRRVESALAAVAVLEDPALRACLAEQLSAVQGGSGGNGGCALEGCVAAAAPPPVSAEQLLHACCCLAARGAARLAQAQEDPACLSDAAAMQAAAGRPHPLSRAELATLRGGVLRCAGLLTQLEPRSPGSLVLAGAAAALEAYTEEGLPAGEAALAGAAAVRMERYLRAFQLATEQGSHWWAIRAAGAALQLAGEPGADSPATLHAVLAAWQHAEAALRQLSRQSGLLPAHWERSAAAEVAAGRRLLQRCGQALSLAEPSKQDLPGSAAAGAALLAATLQRARLDLIRLDSTPAPKAGRPRSPEPRSRLGRKPVVELSRDSAMEFAAED